MVIKQGDVFWVKLRKPDASEPGFLHPGVVIQNNRFNQSSIRTVVICALTSNIQRANSPGNVLLRKGEANLPKRSVINVSQILTVDKAALTEKIGTLSHKRILEILNGFQLLTEPAELE